MEPRMGPFSPTPPSEVLLERAPLAYVVVQVRFPPVLKINEQSFVAGFQEAVRSLYPILRPEQTHGYVITPDGVGRSSPDTTWRFLSIDEAWKVSLAPTFVSIETKRYVSREDFVERVRVIVEALQSTVDPKLVDRIGVRYSNRLIDEDLENLSSLVRSEILGLLNLPIGDEGRVAHQLSEMMAEVQGSKLSARWGTLPPISAPSWILDIDSFVEKMIPAETGEIITQIRQLSERAYTFFRWVMSDAFIEERTRRE